MPFSSSSRTPLLRQIVPEESPMSRTASRKETCGPEGVWNSSLDVVTVIVFALASEPTERRRQRPTDREGAVLTSSPLAGRDRLLHAKLQFCVFFAGRLSLIGLVSDSSLQAGQLFPPTRWSLVRVAEREEVVGELCEQYWSPVYHFLRRSGYSREDAEDLTQKVVHR